MLRKFLALVLGVLLVGGVAFADQVAGMASYGQSVPAKLDSNPSGDGPGVYVNQSGLGDVLIFPYYNARQAVNYIRIVNTSDKGIVGKLRLREGKESEEVLDFLVCLSPHDEFTFWITDPALLGLSGDTAVVVKGTSTALAGDTDTVVYPGNWDVARTRTTTSAGKKIENDRTFEGYVEFFAVSAIDGNLFESKVEKAKDPAGACLSLAEGTLDGVTYKDAPNALMGEAYLFNLHNVSNGISTYAYKAVAVANFKQSAYTTSPTTDAPLFADTDADGGLKAINYIFTKSALYIFTDLQSYLSGETDLILNFLTKKETVDGGYAGDYYVNFSDTKKCEPDKAGNYDYTSCCVPLISRAYDDKEQTSTTSVGFSPVPPGETPKVCYEVSYMPIGDHSPIFDTALSSLSLTPYGELGWISLGFGKGSTTLDNFTVSGQPLLAYQVQSYLGGALDAMLPVAYDLSVISGEGGETSPYTCDTDCTSLPIKEFPLCIGWQMLHCKK